MYTYRATNTTNGKFYIGSTKNFEKRKKQHLKSSENLPFQNALRKNPEAFEWECWSGDSDEPILEQALLDMWFGCGQCYNLNPQASRPPSHKGRVKSEEHKRKLSESQRGRPGTPLSDEAKRHLSELNRGKVNSSETRRKISESSKGKPKSKDHIRKLQEVRGFPVIVTYLDGHEERFISIADAAQASGAPKTTLKRSLKLGRPVCKGKGKGIQIRRA
jgi:group I intron endonuclease